MVSGRCPKPTAFRLNSTRSTHRRKTRPLLLYTSGSTGHPKGALHAHRILEGYLLTFKLFFDVEFDESTVFYTPSDWAWVGGLLDILLPALVFGCPVVADEERFSAERAFEVIGRNGVTHAFLTPTALKVMAQVPDPGPRFDLDLRVIASGGESVATNCTAGASVIWEPSSTSSTA